MQGMRQHTQGDSDRRVDDERAYRDKDVLSQIRGDRVDDISRRITKPEVAYLKDLRFRQLTKSRMSQFVNNHPWKGN